MSGTVGLVTLEQSDWPAAAQNFAALGRSTAVLLLSRLSSSKTESPSMQRDDEASQ